MHSPRLHIEYKFRSDTMSNKFDRNEIMSAREFSFRKRSGRLFKHHARFPVMARRLDGLVCATANWSFSKVNLLFLSLHFSKYYIDDNDNTWHGKVKYILRYFRTRDCNTSDR